MFPPEKSRMQSHCWMSTEFRDLPPQLRRVILPLAYHGTHSTRLPSCRHRNLSSLACVRVPCGPGEQVGGSSELLALTHFSMQLFISFRKLAVRAVATTLYWILLSRGWIWPKTRCLECLECLQERPGRPRPAQVQHSIRLAPSKDTSRCVGL